MKFIDLLMCNENKTNDPLLCWLPQLPLNVTDFPSSPVRFLNLSLICFYLIGDTEEVNNVTLLGWRTIDSIALLKI